MLWKIPPSPGNLSKGLKRLQRVGSFQNMGKCLFTRVSLDLVCYCIIMASFESRPKNVNT